MYDDRNREDIDADTLAIYDEGGEVDIIFKICSYRSLYTYAIWSDFNKKKTGGN